MEVFGPVDRGPVDRGPVDIGPVDIGPVNRGPVCLLGLYLTLTLLDLCGLNIKEESKRELSSCIILFRREWHHSHHLTRGQKVNKHGSQDVQLFLSAQ